MATKAAARNAAIDRLLARATITPLGMTSTAFKITPAMRERLAKIHQRGDDDSLTPQRDLEIPQDAEFDMGAAVFTPPRAIISNLCA
jgi:methyl acetate hydrolase